MIKFQIIFILLLVVWPILLISSVHSNTKQSTKTSANIYEIWSRIEKRNKKFDCKSRILIDKFSGVKLSGLLRCIQLRKKQSTNGKCSFFE